MKILKEETVANIIVKVLGAALCFCRSLIFSILFRESGSGLMIRSNVKISGSKNIICGKKCYIGRNVVLDATSGELRIGNNVEIRDNARIYAKKVLIGDGVTIGEGAFLNGNINIAASAWISHGCDLTGSVRIGRAILGPKTSIITGDHPRDPRTGEILMSGGGGEGVVVIEDGAWTGQSSIVLKNVTIKKNMVVGAGSVVTKTFSANDVIAGNPAKLIHSKLSL